MGNREAKPLTARLLSRRFEFLQHYWKEVGTSLDISQDTLEKVDKECRQNSQKLERVITKWIEETECLILLPHLTRILVNANFVQQDNIIQQRLNNLEDDRNNSEEPIPRRSNRRCSTYCLSNLFLLTALLIPVVAATMGMYVVRRDTDTFVKFLEDNENYVDKLLGMGVREIRILVTGKTGTGKSALINGIIRQDVMEEGKSSNPMIAKVEKFKRIVRGIPMIVFDSPGLQDGTKNEKEYLLDMEQKCKEVDLVLYTLKMSDKPIHTEDTEAMKKLTHVFGEQFWVKAIFVLTFANEVRDPENPQDKASNMIYFEHILNQWGKKLPMILQQKLNVPKKVAERIPIIPAGYHKQPHLPGQRYWFSEFWQKALNRMNETGSDGYRMLLEFQRNRFKGAYELTPEELKRNLHEQPIVMRPTDSLPASGTTAIVALLVVSIMLFQVFLEVCMM